MADQTWSQARACYGAVLSVITTRDGCGSLDSDTTTGQVDHGAVVPQGTDKSAVAVFDAVCAADKEANTSGNEARAEQAEYVAWHRLHNADRAPTVHCGGKAYPHTALGHPTKARPMTAAYMTSLVPTIAACCDIDVGSTPERAGSTLCAQVECEVSPIEREGSGAAQDPRAALFPVRVVHSCTTRVGFLRLSWP